MFDSPPSPFGVPSSPPQAAQAYVLPRVRSSFAIAGAVAQWARGHTRCLVLPLTVLVLTAMVGVAAAELIGREALPLMPALLRAITLPFSFLASVGLIVCLREGPIDVALFWRRVWVTLKVLCLIGVVLGFAAVGGMVLMVTIVSMASTFALFVKESLLLTSLMVVVESMPVLMVIGGGVLLYFVLRFTPVIFLAVLTDETRARALFRMAWRLSQGKILRLLRWWGGFSLIVLSLYMLALLIADIFVLLTGVPSVVGALLTSGIAAIGGAALELFWAFATDQLVRMRPEVVPSWRFFARTE